MPQELLPIMPPSVLRLCVAGIGAEGEPVLAGGVPQFVQHDAGLARAHSARSGFNSTMRFMYLEKSSSDSDVDGLSRDARAAAARDDRARRAGGRRRAYAPRRRHLCGSTTPIGSMR